MTNVIDKSLFFIERRSNSLDAYQQIADKHLTREGRNPPVYADFGHPPPEPNRYMGWITKDILDEVSIDE